MFVTPRKAATVSIIKDNSGRMEVLLMRRHLNDRFLPDYLVFPGGAVDPGDSDYKDSDIKFPHKLKDFDGNPDEVMGHIICGIRETFEESGFLLALNSRGAYPSINTKHSIEKFDRYRRSVFDKRISFKEMLDKEKLKPAVEKCFYMNRWVTPPLFPIRYDTRFFTAIAPANQVPSHDGDELVEMMWMTPDEALKGYRKDKIKLVMPTIRTLEFLSRFKESARVLDYFHD